VGGYASYIVPAAFVLILQQTLLIGAAMLTGTALASAGGAFAGVLGRGVAHLTIYLPALALYLIVLPRSTAFPRSDIFHKSSRSRPSSCWRRASWDRPSGLVHTAGERNPPPACNQPAQFFTAGFAWPREAIPDAAIALGRMFPAIPRSTGWCASTSSAPTSGKSGMTGSGCGVWRVAISCSRRSRHLPSREERNMRKTSRAAIAVIALVLVAGVLITSARRSGPAASIVGVVRTTEIRWNRR